MDKSFLNANENLKNFVGKKVKIFKIFNDEDMSIIFEDGSEMVIKAWSGCVPEIYERKS